MPITMTFAINLRKFHPVAKYDERSHRSRPIYRSCIDVLASGATRHKFRGDAAARTGGIPIIGSCKVATSGNRTLSDFGTFL